MSEKEIIKRINKLVQEKYPKELITGYVVYNGKYICGYRTENDEDSFNARKYNGKYYYRHYNSLIMEYDPEKDTVVCTSYPRDEWQKIQDTCKYTELIKWET